MQILYLDIFISNNLFKIIIQKQCVCCFVHKAQKNYWRDKLIAKCIVAFKTTLKIDNRKSYCFKVRLLKIDYQRTCSLRQCLAFNKIHHFKKKKPQKTSKIHWFENIELFFRGGGGVELKVIF